MSIESDAYKLFHLVHKRTSPCCLAPSIEIVSIEHPVGPTGIFKCLVCDAVFDPTWRQADAIE
jgi:hypothetical protein